MKTSDVLQIALYAIILAAITKPMGLYLVQVLAPDGRTPLDRFLKPLERFSYWCLGVNPQREQTWKEYTWSLLSVSAVSCLFTYAVLRLQGVLPLNPQAFGGVSPDLAFNTAVSFTTNTNWQSYGGESTLSYFSQMVGLTLHNFLSAAVGIAVAAAFVRSLARSATPTLGNFWVDLIRITYYLLLPLSFALALFLVSQGMIQNLRPYTPAIGIEASATANPKPSSGVPTNGNHLIPQGPMASQVAIKMLGTNGGGFTNANAAHPFENPTPLANGVQMFAIFAIGSGLTWYLGRLMRNQAHGWTLWGAMMVLFLVAAVVCSGAELAGNPIHQRLGLAVDGGNMEGKEVRFGALGSALFATITTAASCGAVNAMHDSFTALGGLVTLFNIQLGEVVIGGVGSGLYGILVFVILAVFIAGLMIGRTPEYLGKKINAYEVRMAMLVVLVSTLTVLLLTALAAVSRWGTAGLNNTGPHGLTELLYAFSSATGNNGSAFAGLTTNSPAFNIALGVAMLLGRFWVIVPVLALAGSLSRKSIAPESAASFPVTGFTFLGLVVGTILMVGALSFLPALALGPIVEHFLTAQGTLF